MKIKVADTALVRLADELDRANRGAHKHVARPGDIFALAERAEQSLTKSGLTARERAGAEVVWHAGGPAAEAYGFKMTRTCVTLVRGRQDWFLTGVERVGVYPRQSELYCVTISEAQRNRIVAAALHDFDVRDDVDSADVDSTTALAVEMSVCGILTEGSLQNDLQ